MGTREYWLYELTRGHGIYQGATGPGAEGIVRRVVKDLLLDPHEAPGEPFRVFCFEGLKPNQPTPLEMYEAGHIDVQKAGFCDSGELLSAYRTLLKAKATADERAATLTDTLAAAEILLTEVSSHFASYDHMPDSLLSRIDNFLEGNHP